MVHLEGQPAQGYGPREPALVVLEPGMTSKKSFEPTERVTRVSLIDHVQARFGTRRTPPINVKSHILVLAMAAAQKWNFSSSSTQN